ncbi:phosphate signaling complex PhoU family protein, partial [Sphingomonas bacterium]|uniref:phosphate signaling complex PhoU family protein n=1 Tax=Sphingomonas bacterium TaxID=1895847 RepID=UPI00266FC629
DLAEAEDSEIDQLEIRIDDMVVTFISTHAVVASDTRFVLTASKIANNLERIADEATTIARRARELNGEPPLQPLVDIPLMAATAQETTGGRPRDDVGHGTTAKEENGRASPGERKEQRRKFLGIF